MGKLKCLVVADPSEEVAKTIVEETERLAIERPTASTGQEAIALVKRYQPEAILLSLEIEHPEADAVIKEVLEIRPGIFVVATFRELAVPTMDRLDRLGVEDFIPQPIDFTQLFRAASTRFNTAFRRHTRYRATLEVYRADGVLVGRTLDISEGGLAMTCEHPVHAESSLLIDLALPNDEKIRVRCEIIASEGEPPKTVSARGQFQNLRGADKKRLREFLHTQEPDDAG
jgi:DNA-binding NtrC family response regulator